MPEAHEPGTVRSVTQAVLVLDVWYQVEDTHSTVELVQKPVSTLTKIVTPFTIPHELQGISHLVHHVAAQAGNRNVRRTPVVLAFPKNPQLGLQSCRSLRRSWRS